MLLADGRIFWNLQMATPRGVLKNTRHSTLTPTAARAARALSAAGLRPHPGVIDPGPCKGDVRITVTAEPNRVRVCVSGNGHQEILVYGASTQEEVTVPLQREFGDKRVRTRDPYHVWSAAC
jgi:hypothetical protein